MLWRKTSDVADWRRMIDLWIAYKALMSSIRDNKPYTYRRYQLMSENTTQRDMNSN